MEARLFLNILEGNVMKLIVDKIPKKSSDCLFSEYDCGYTICKFDGAISCALERNEKCPFLKEMESNK